MLYLNLYNNNELVAEKIPVKHLNHALQIARSPKLKVDKGIVIDGNNALIAEYCKSYECSNNAIRWYKK